MITLIELEDHLSGLLGVKVDLGVKDDLKPPHKKRVLSELVTV